MKVLFVCNNVYTTGNGLSTSARVTIKNLKAAGVDVRLMSGENPNYEGPEPDYPLRKFHFLFFQPIIEANSYSFSIYDKELTRKAVEWADVIHIEEAFPLEQLVIREAERQGKKIVGTFHLFTQNIFYNLGMGSFRLINLALMSIWKHTVYDHMSHIQCPTETVRKELERHRFKSELRVISNGIEVKTPNELKTLSTPPYTILTIGRMASEKNQITLIKAMRYCKHAGEIQLHFAGKGMLRDRFRRMCIKLYRDGILKYPAEFGFYSSAQLREIASKSYLYVHCAVVEVEGLSCAESLREGAVPIIGDARLSATKDFALCPESIFKSRNPKSLAKRIDWWIEHPEEHEKMRKAYAESAGNYEIGKSTAALIQMYEDALSN